VHGIWLVKGHLAELWRNLEKAGLSSRIVITVSLRRIAVVVLRELPGFCGGEERFAELLGILEEIGRRSESAWTRAVKWVP
jgi:hypothetical protein